MLITGCPQQTWSDHQALHTCTGHQKLTFLLCHCVRFDPAVWGAAENARMFPCCDILACPNGRRTWHRSTTQHTPSGLWTPRDPPRWAAASHWGVGCLGYHVYPAGTSCSNLDRYLMLKNRLWGLVEFFRSRIYQVKVEISVLYCCSRIIPFTHISIVSFPDWIFVCIALCICLA